VDLILACHHRSFDGACRYCEVATQGVLLIVNTDESRACESLRHVSVSCFVLSIEMCAAARMSGG
jgi:hypothetical protein